MSRGRLPAELYREIVEHIQKPSVLFELLSVSRLLSNEAERVLYSSVSVDMQTAPQKWTISINTIHYLQFSHFERVGHHVQFASFLWIGITTRDFLIPMLLSMPNIKTLNLAFGIRSRSAPFLSFLPDKVPFHLLQLGILGHEGDNGLLSFLQSQSRIGKLSWKSRTGIISPIPLSPSDLPHLTSLKSPHPDIIKLILGRQVRLLDTSDAKIGLWRFVNQCESRTPFLSVQSLHFRLADEHSSPSPHIQDVDTLSKLFPNLQNLVIHITTLYNNLLANLLLFKHLNKLSLLIDPPTMNAETHSQFASKLFTCHERITVVEQSHHDGLWWIFERGFEEDESLVSLVVEEFTA